MSVIGNRTSSILDPRSQMPAPPPRPPSRPGGGDGQREAVDYSLHPAVQAATAQFSDAMRELDNAREIIRTLQHRVDVQESTIKELEHTVDGERSQKESFQRYCVRARTLISAMAQLAREADDAAVDAALQKEPKKTEQQKPRSQLEQDITAAVDDLRNAAQ